MIQLHVFKQFLVFSFAQTPIYSMGLLCPPLPPWGPLCSDSGWGEQKGAYRIGWLHVCRVVVFMLQHLSAVCEASHNKSLETSNNRNDVAILGKDDRQIHYVSACWALQTHFKEAQTILCWGGIRGHSTHVPREELGDVSVETGGQRAHILGNMEKAT